MKDVMFALKRCLLIALGLCWAGICVADPAIWQVKGKYNTLYLLGTIHVLRSDEALPNNIDKAYQQAERLLMEIDMDDLDPFATQALMLKLGMLPDGKTLHDELDAATNQKLKTTAQAIGFDAAVLEHFQPWLAALTIEQLELTKLGFAGDTGVEMRLTQRAAADHKPIAGLETLEQQLNLFAQLSDQAQRDYLAQTLTELEQGPTELETLLSAWRKGDEQQLQRTLQQGFVDDPKLFAALTTDRNRRWLTEIKPLLDESHDDYLVAVGALHLVGNEGLVALLKQAGYTVTRQ